MPKKHPAMIGFFLISFVRFLIVIVIIPGNLLLSSAANAQVRVGTKFIRGDANADGKVDLSDPVFTLSFLFTGGSGPVCQDAADANDDGALNLSDAIATLGFLFQATTASLPLNGNLLSVDPTSDGLQCHEYPNIDNFPLVTLPPADADKEIKIENDVPALRSLLASMGNDVSLTPPAQYLSWLADSLTQTTDPWTLTLNLSANPENPDEFPLKLASPQDGTSASVVFSGLSDADCTSYINLGIPAPGGADTGGAVEGSTAATGCCEEGHPAGNPAGTETSWLCYTASKTNCPKSITIQMGTVVNWVKDETCDSGTSRCTVPAPEETNTGTKKKYKGICGQISVASSLYFDLGLAPDDAVKGKNWNPDFIEEIDAAAGANGGGTKTAQRQKAYKKFGGDDIKCSSSDSPDNNSDSEVSTAEMKKWCEDLNTNLDFTADCILTLSDTAGKKGHAERVREAEWDSDSSSCKIKTVNTGNQGNGNAENIPINPGTHDLAVGAGETQADGTGQVSVNLESTTGRDADGWAKRNYDKVANECCWKEK